MAGDITSTIRFIADASQALGTMRALAAEAQGLNRAISGAQTEIFRAQTGGNGRIFPTINQAQTAVRHDPRLAGQQLGLRATTEADDFNRTLKTVRDSVVLARDGTELMRTTIKSYSGDLTKVIATEAQYGRVLSETNRIKRDGVAIFGQERAIRNQAIFGIQQQATAQDAAGINRLRTLREEMRELSRLREIESTRPRTQPGGTHGRFISPNSPEALARVAQLDAARNFKNYQRETLAQQIIDNRNGLQGLIDSDPAVLAARERIRRLKDALIPTIGAGRALQKAALGEISKAYAGAPPLPAVLDTVRRESPNAFNRLAAQGLGKESKDGPFTTRALYESGAHQLQLTRDLERGTTSLRGTVRALDGSLQNINVTYDKGGTVIGRYGGILSGTQNFLRQTVNNLQKVVQWGLATTAMFGALQLAASSVKNITSLDAALNQLSITAELSATQTGAVFDDLAKIAFETSTPLQEMVKAADDIALATKKANQSTTEWQSNIKSLATSVGILTNITGLDTVRATDLLTSTMKQLNLEANDLPGIINKISAVSGGQANSITDVAQGLGAMAEAAQQASLSLDQTIGVVQVLGQVTSKSSSEIATAFKNLTGSVDSVGGSKALRKYGIEIKDTEGNLRNILDIYSEIQDKIRSGIIPEADVKGLVKAIAGGPRRAPDAAALLANVDAIKEAAERASKATNEGLIANAKYLNTIESKITQIQVKFDTFINKTFGPALKGFVGDAATVISGLLELIEGIDPGVVKAGLGFVALGVAVTSFLAIAKFAGKGIYELIKGLNLTNIAAKVAEESFKITGSTALVASEQQTLAHRAVIASIDAEILSYRELASTALATGRAEQASAAASFEAAAIRKKAALEGTTIGRFGVSSKAALAGGIAGATAIGGAIGLATGGGDLKQIAGQALIGGGLQALIALPGPLKLAGAAALALGGILTFTSGEADKASDSMTNLGAETLAAVNKYTEAQDSINNLQKKQAQAKADFDRLTTQAVGATGKEAAEAANSINAKIIEYAQATKDLTDANRALAESFKEIKTNAGSIDSKFGTRIQEAKAGNLPAEQITKLKTAIYNSIFESLYPELNANVLAKDQITTNKFDGTGTKAYLPGGGRQIDNLSIGNPKDGFYFELPIATGFKEAEASTLNLKKDLKEASNVLKLFNVDGTQMVATFDHSAEAVDLIRSALQEVIEKNGANSAQAKEALGTFNDIASQMDIIKQADIFAKSQSTGLQVQNILGEINSDQVKQGNALIAIYTHLKEVAAGLPSGGNPDNIRENNRLSGGLTNAAPTSENLQKIIQATLINKEGNIRTDPLPVKEATLLAEQLGIAKDLTDGRKLSDEAISGILYQVWGIETTITAEKLRQATISQEEIDREEKLKDLKTGSLETLAGKMQDINKRFLQGDITKKMRDALYAGAQETQNLDDAVVTLLGDIGNNHKFLDQFTETLSKVPGLEDLAGTNAEVAAEKLLKYFDSMELTGKGAKGLRNQILALIAALTALPNNIEILVSIVTQYTTRRTFIGTEGNDPDSRQLANDAFNGTGTGASSAVSNYSNLQKQLKTLFNQINNIATGKSSGSTFLGSTGSGSGAGSKTGSGYDISNLDLPEEIANSANRTALIAEAIKRATALQAKIPGASKEAKNDIVELLKGTQRILEVRGVKDDLLRKALEELAAVEKKRLEFETKADTIRRIRVGSGDFAALANVPLNSQTGVSVGGPQGPISVNLNINGQILTPAQFSALADQIGAAIKKQLGA